MQLQQVQFRPQRLTLLHTGASPWLITSFPAIGFCMDRQTQASCSSLSALPSGAATPGRHCLRPFSQLSVLAGQARRCSGHQAVAQHSACLWQGDAGMGSSTLCLPFHVAGAAGTSVQQQAAAFRECLRNKHKADLQSIRQCPALQAWAMSRLLCCQMH